MLKTRKLLSKTLKESQKEKANLKALVKDKIIGVICTLKKYYFNVLKHQIFKIPWVPNNRQGF